MIPKEDVVSLNFEEVGSGWFEFKGDFSGVEYFTKIMLRRFGDKILTIRGYRGAEEDYLFQGDIETRDELAVLMKQLRLKP